MISHSYIVNGIMMMNEIMGMLVKGSMMMNETMMMKDAA